MNLYLFVSDANAPLPLYDIDTSSWSDAQWANPENVERVAKSIFLYGNEELVDDIQNDAPLPPHINRKLLKYLSQRESNHWVANQGNPWSEEGGYFTWKALIETNNLYHKNRE